MGRTNKQTRKHTHTHTHINTMTWPGLWAGSSKNSTPPLNFFWEKIRNLFFYHGISPKKDPNTLFSFFWQNAIISTHRKSWWLPYAGFFYIGALVFILVLWRFINAMAFILLPWYLYWCHGIYIGAIIFMLVLCYLYWCHVIVICTMVFTLVPWYLYNLYILYILYILYVLYKSYIYISYMYIYYIFYLFEVGAENLWRVNDICLYMDLVFHT